MVDVAFTRSKFNWRVWIFVSNSFMVCKDSVYCFFNSHIDEDDLCSVISNYLIFVFFSSTSFFNFSIYASISSIYFSLCFRSSLIIFTSSTNWFKIAFIFKISSSFFANSSVWTFERLYIDTEWYSFKADNLSYFSVNVAWCASTDRHFYCNYFWSYYIFYWHYLSKLDNYWANLCKTSSFVWISRLMLYLYVYACNDAYSKSCRSLNICLFDV